MVTGFPLAVFEGNAPGDFALDFGNNGTYEFGVETTGNWGTSKQGELFKHASWSNTQYFSVCNPFALNGGVSLGNVLFAYDNLTYIANKHYAFEIGIPINLLTPLWVTNFFIPKFSAHWTMQCGNNCITLNLDSVVHTPEPSTILLTLFGGLGTILLRRRKK
ncbi:MAG: PEP-CTERM sorting domain-containing protein [Candidatus Omnitrophica bacterium]|nr:PEP-CTERM sorting domain-containing protein [Candidatus Omnitrophota bacterium]